MSSVLFVCLGNICRSPAAEGVLKATASRRGCRLHVESCGIGDWHVGSLPDERMREVARRRGYFLESRAQEFKPEFFEIFDYIFAADQEILAFLLSEAKKAEHKKKVAYITAYSKKYADQPVPDPYYGDPQSFEHVLDMIEDACEGIVDHVMQEKHA